MNTNSSEKRLSQTIQQQSSQILSSSANATAPSYHSDGPASGDNRHTATTISNTNVTLSPNQTISSAMNATSMSTAAGTSTNGANACQPRQHPKKRKFNIADLEEIEPTTVQANSHSHNSNNNNNNTINTNKNNGSQNGMDANFGAASAPITNPATVHSDIIDKSNKNWPISNDNGSRASNAIIVTHTGHTVQTIARPSEHTLVVSSNSHQIVPSTIAHAAHAAHDSKGSHSQFSQHSRKTDNGSTKTDNDSIMIIRNEYPVIASHDHSTAALNATNPMPNINHRMPHPSESLKFGVQSSSIIRIGPAAATSEQSLDLSEWCNHRVLARQEDIYVAGIIRSVDSSNTILVEFDYPEGTQQSYYDVLGAGRFDIISDASPSMGDITSGTRVVCQSTNRLGNTSFSVCEIMQILNDTKQFVVRTIASEEMKKVKRAQIRLLQPPWWDELNDSNTLGDGGNSTRVITGQIKSMHAIEPNIYTNTMAGAVAAAASSNSLNPNGAANATNNRSVKYVNMTPLHLLPTVQVICRQCVASLQLG